MAEILQWVNLALDNSLTQAKYISNYVRHWKWVEKGGERWKELHWVRCESVSPGTTQQSSQHKVMVNTTVRQAIANWVELSKHGVQNSGWQLRTEIPQRRELQRKEEVLENTFKFSSNPCLTPKRHTLRKTENFNGKNSWKTEGTEPRLQLVPMRSGKNLDLIPTSLEGYRKDLRLPRDTEKDQDLRWQNVLRELL